MVAILPSDSEDKRQLVENGLAVGANMRKDDPTQIAYYRVVLTFNPKCADENTDLIISLFQKRVEAEKAVQGENQDLRLIQAAEKLTPEFIETIKKANRERVGLEQIKHDKQVQDIEDQRELEKRRKVLEGIKFSLSDFAAVWQVAETIDPADSDLFHQYLRSLAQGLIHPDMEEFEKQLEERFQQIRKEDSTFERSKLEYWYKDIIRNTYYCVEEMLTYNNLPPDILEMLLNEKLLIDLVEPQGLYFSGAAESIQRYSQQWLAASTMENKTAELIAKTISAYQQAEDKKDRDNLAQAIDQFLTIPQITISDEQLAILLNTFLQRKFSTYDLGMITASFTRQIRQGRPIRKINQDSELVLSHLHASGVWKVNEMGADFIDHAVYNLDQDPENADEKFRQRRDIYLGKLFKRIIRQYPEYINLNAAYKFIERWSLLKNLSINPFLFRLTNLLLSKNTLFSSSEADAERLTIFIMFDDEVKWLLGILNEPNMPEDQKRIFCKQTFGTVLGQNEKEILTYGQKNLPDYEQFSFGWAMGQLQKNRAELEKNPLVSQYLG